MFTGRSRIDDTSDDFLIAEETVACSCSEVNVHCAASIVSPRNLTGVVWKRGDEADIVGVASPPGKGIPDVPTGPGGLPNDDAVEPARLRVLSDDGLLGLRGPVGGGGRARG